MASPGQGLVRWFRSVVLALVVLVVSVTAHVIGGGALPSVLALAASGVAVTWVCWGLTRWQLSRPTSAAALAGGQLALHQAFMALAPTPMPGMVHGGQDHVMLAAHAVATVVLALLLADGERALWRMWAWLVPLVLRVLTRAVVLPARRSVRRGRDGVRPHDVVLLRAVSRRGPPVGLPG